MATGDRTELGSRKIAVWPTPLMRAGLRASRGNGHSAPARVASTPSERLAAAMLRAVARMWPQVSSAAEIFAEHVALSCFENEGRRDFDLSGRAGGTRQQPENEDGNQENACGQSHDGLL